ncbi:MAG: 3-dehydroquinate synthase [Phycisphaerales bacterium]|jgi:3-dehydroquinate synthase|nr:3-dehydroquinate synthase [Phycisphaerales bacterium]
MSTRIPLTSRQGDYEVVIEPGCLRSAAGFIGEACQARRVLVVADEQVLTPHAGVLLKSLQPDGWEATITTLRAEEPLKRMEAVERVWEVALAGGLDRHSAIIAVGGGLTGDVAGFAAATFLRGIDLIQVPTTLLAMVDASIGGKTGVNLPIPDVPHVGKNLAGAFWPPKLVLVDAETLATLPLREFRSGLAECVKHAIISDSELMTLLERNAATLREGECGGIEEVLVRSITAKRHLVQEDEREAGSRMLLNLGHTFAHAIEPIEALDLTHGEAVSIGLCAALACSERLGLCGADAVNRVRLLLENLGLPVSIARPEPVEDLFAAMRYDKKVEGDRLRLVLPTRDGACVRDDVASADIEAAWHSVMPPSSG